MTSERYILMIAVCVIASTGWLRAQNQFDDSRLIHSRREEMLYEINEIRFQGNDAFPYDELYGVVGSRPSNRSVFHQFLEYYYFGAKSIGATPVSLMRALESALQSLSREIRYFDQNQAELDVENLWNYYNKHGFHDAVIYYNFAADTAEAVNVLTFYIEESTRYRIDTLRYTGIHDLPEEITEKILRQRRIESGDYFDEDDISLELSQINRELLNNGYYFAKYQKPVVQIDTTSNTDSVYTDFDPGPRKKFGEITFIDSTMGQPGVATSMKRRQLAFEEGGWYSREQVRQSIDNLLSLGTFDVVAIDTSYKYSPGTDSTLPFRVFTRYRKQQEWGVGFLVDKTLIDKLVNFGIEAEYIHRNIFGAAQVFNLYGNASIKDVSRFINDFNAFEYEITLGFKFSQPLLWTIDYSRVGFFMQPVYSFRLFNNFLQLQTISLPFKFPVRMPDWVYIDNVTFDLTFERQQPIEFDKAINSALRDAETNADSTRVYEAFVIYNNLNSYMQSAETHLLTANLLGVSVVADKRDHPFRPTSGNFTYMALDGWNFFLANSPISGLAKYFRFQISRYEFTEISPRLVAAVKGRVGGIFEFDKENSYVPYERQFFAGGANSVRGWASRDLRYSRDTSSRSDYAFASNYIGNAALVEGSFELRYRFSRPIGVSEIIADQVQNLGITAFVDVGNAFDWYAESVTRTEFTDYFTKLAVAAGFGFRYATPVGPVRLDFAWPLYDPSLRGYQFDKYVAFDKIKFHIGLGHAF
ncbi:MAG: autotransporter assembly complex protein TamA [Candidatus Kapaibacterium sp.]